MNSPSQPTHARSRLTPSAHLSLAAFSSDVSPRSRSYHALSTPNPTSSKTPQIPPMTSSTASLRSCSLTLSGRSTINLVYRYRHREYVSANSAPRTSHACLFISRGYSRNETRNMWLCPRNLYNHSLTAVTFLQSSPSPPNLAPSSMIIKCPAVRCTISPMAPTHSIPLQPPSPTSASRNITSVSHLIPAAASAVTFPK
ncbi:hypothetical protein CaCOL14_009236 [Colletotrichum acutatum]